MTILYLQKALLRDRLFLRDFFANYKQLKGKSIVLHEALEADIAQTRFLSKRISAQLSEQMVTNNPYSGEQRGLLTEAENRYTLRAELLTDWHKMVDCLVLSPIVHSESGPKIVVAEDLISIFARNASHFLFFPDNPLSPLGSEPRNLDDPAVFDRLSGLFPEEQSVLDRAWRHRPATILSPRGFGL